MNESQNQPPEDLPAEAYGAGAMVPAAGQVMIQTTGAGSTARKMVAPRSLPNIMKNLKVMAAMAGEDFYYRWPVKNNKENTVDWVEGPSIKCATAVASMFGNCEVTCVLRESLTHHIFEAYFTDLETGFHLMRPYQQRKTQNMGKKMDADRQADIVFQIGVSKATRNVINNALATFTDFAKEEAKKSLIEKIGKDLPGSISRILTLFKEHKIDVKRVEAVYGKSQKEWLAPDVAKMVAELRALDDGMATMDETYPPTAQEQAAHVAEVEAQAQTATGGAGAAPAGQQEGDKPPSDWEAQIDDVIAGLNACTSAEGVSKFVEDNQPTLQSIATSAPREAQLKWTKAFTTKMGSFKKAEPAKGEKAK